MKTKEIEELVRMAFVEGFVTATEEYSKYAGDYIDAGRFWDNSGVKVVLETQTQAKSYTCR